MLFAYVYISIVSDIFLDIEIPLRKPHFSHPMAKKTAFADVCFYIFMSMFLVEQAIQACVVLAISKCMYLVPQCDTNRI